MLDYFKEEKTCKAYLAEKRWGDTPSCVHCGNVGGYVTNRGYKCKECKKKFSVITGTVFENTKLPLRTWFAAIYLATAHKKGISSLQLSRDLNITQSSAWFLLHRIRKMIKDNSIDKLSGVVEADATYVGGNITKMPKKKRDRLNAIGTGSSTKKGVFGMVQRDGKVITHVIDKETQPEIHPLVQQHLQEGSMLVTDGHGCYKGMKQYQHEVLSHEKGEYVRDHYHTGFIDGFWSQLKRMINGTYHFVSVKHLGTYCIEQAFRYNTRDLSDYARFSESFVGCNTRLRYADLVRK